MNNKTMMTDLYELTMSQVYFNENKKDEIAIFDAFFRKEPMESGYAVMAGLDNLIEYIQNLKFTNDDIEYLRTLNLFNEPFLEYLKKFKFTGEICAIPDGTPVFRNTPLITVKAPIIETQIIETALLSYLNAGICYATAARRIIESAGNINVMEFGARRALGPDAAVEASKCAIMVGAIGTSNVLAGKKYNIPVMGTMAHSFVTESNSEYEAFLNFAKTYPDNCFLLVDTYDTLKSGIPNAIKVAKEFLLPNGYRLKGIRIDSGDLAYLSKEARKMLDDAGFRDAKICLSNGINNKTIESLKIQGAEMDVIGLGDNIVLPDKARVGCVYKNVAIIKKNQIIPKIKLSGDIIKTINPGYKKVYRIYDKKTKYALADLIALHGEEIPKDKYLLIDPDDETNIKHIKDYEIEELQIPIFIEGKLVYENPNVFKKREYCNDQMKTLYPEIKRIEKPHKYYVNLSKNLLVLKRDMIMKIKNNNIENKKQKVKGLK